MSRIHSAYTPEEGLDTEYLAEANRLAANMTTEDVLGLLHEANRRARMPSNPISIPNVLEGV